MRFRVNRHIIKKIKTKVLTGGWRASHFFVFSSISRTRPWSKTTTLWARSAGRVNPWERRKGAWARWPGKVLFFFYFVLARSTVYSRTQRNKELARIKFLNLFLLYDVRASLMFLCLFLFTVHKAKHISVYAYSALDRERKRKWCSGRSPTMAPRPRWPDSVLALQQMNAGHRGTSFLLFLFFLAHSSIICVCDWAGQEVCAAY